MCCIRGREKRSGAGGQKAVVVGRAGAYSTGKKIGFCRSRRDLVNVDLRSSVLLLLLLLLMMMPML